jgi:glutaredoxin
MRLTLVTRKRCHLCDAAAADLRALGLEFDEVDVDSEPELLALYDHAVPVVLAGGRELCRAPFSRQDLLSALRAVSLGSGS